ncbi:hypothetical protein V1520DRAFT_331292 [Lipomyces starkeyi]
MNFEYSTPKQQIVRSNYLGAIVSGYSGYRHMLAIPALFHMRSAKLSSGLVYEIIIFLMSISNSRCLFRSCNYARLVIVIMDAMERC